MPPNCSSRNRISIALSYSAKENECLIVEVVFSRSLYHQTLTVFLPLPLELPLIPRGAISSLFSFAYILLFSGILCSLVFCRCCSLHFSFPSIDFLFVSLGKFNGLLKPSSFLQLPKIHELNFISFSFSSKLWLTIFFNVEYCIEWTLNQIWS